MGVTEISWWEHVGLPRASLLETSWNMLKHVGLPPDLGCYEWWVSPKLKGMVMVTRWFFMASPHWSLVPPFGVRLRLPTFRALPTSWWSCCPSRPHIFLAEKPSAWNNHDNTDFFLLIQYCDFILIHTARAARQLLKTDRTATTFVWGTQDDPGWGFRLGYSSKPNISQYESIIISYNDTLIMADVELSMSLTLKHDNWNMTWVIYKK